MRRNILWLLKSSHQIVFKNEAKVDDLNLKNRYEKYHLKNRWEKYLCNVYSLISEDTCRYRYRDIDIDLHLFFPMFNRCAN